MSPWLGQILRSWNFDPSVLGGLVLLGAVYWYFEDGPGADAPMAEGSRRRSWCFAGLVVLTFLALQSPLDFVADRYLFSAHMLQHLMLMLGVAPLLALAVPPSLVRRVPGWLGCVIFHPVVVFVAAAADVWLWHAPVLYEATLHSEGIHVLEHLSFVATSALFWWIAFDPHHLPVLARMGWVFIGGIPNLILGAIITFAPVVLYPSYQLALEQPGLGSYFAEQHGLTALVDQQLGGLLMWVPGGFVYLSVIIGIFLSWYAHQQPARAQAV